METEETKNQSFDIGGDEVITYEGILKTQAALFGKKKLFFSSFISNIKFFSYITSFLTPVPTPIIHCLLEGSKSDAVCQNNKIRELIPMKHVGFREALVRALTREEQDRVYTRWSDAYPPAHELAIKLCELEKEPEFTVSYSLLSTKKASALFKSLCKIGGKTGWFNTNWMWKLRGMIDRIFEGVGTARGRRSFSTLRTNDVIDFWRVEKLIVNTRLLLRAEMKLPGKAWLEFRIERVEDKEKLTVQAYFSTTSIWGKAYWYFLQPFHVIVFNDLIKQIEKVS